MSQLDNTEQPPEAPHELPEHRTRTALAYPLKVIVSPLKAFKEITQNPSIIGLILIVGLFLIAAAGQEYAQASRIILDDGSQSTVLLNSSLFASNFTLVLVQSFYRFLLSWIFFAGILFLMTRLLGERSFPMRHFFVVVGYAFSVVVVYGAISSLLITTLPQVHFETTVWSSNTREAAQTIQNIINQEWIPTATFSVLNILGFVFPFWLMLLGSIVLHVSSDTKWVKAVLISLVAYFASIILTTLLFTLL